MKLVLCSIVKVFLLRTFNCVRLAKLGEEFGYVRLPNLIEVNRTIEFDYRTLDLLCGGKWQQILSSALIFFLPKSYSWWMNYGTIFFKVTLYLGITFNTLFSRLYKLTRHGSKIWWILFSVYINKEAVFRNSLQQAFQDNGSRHKARTGMGETLQDRLYGWFKLALLWYTKG